MQKLLLIIVTQPLFKSAPTCLGLFTPQTLSIPLHAAAASDALGGGGGREGVEKNKWRDAGVRERVDVMTAITVCSTWSCPPPPRPPPLSSSLPQPEVLFHPNGIFLLMADLSRTFPYLKCWSLSRDLLPRACGDCSSRGSAESHITQLELGPW